MRPLTLLFLSLLATLTTLTARAPGAAALDIPWQQYLEVLGFYSGLGCASLHLSLTLCMHAGCCLPCINLLYVTSRDMRRADQCTFVENPSQNVRSYLQTHLRAQDRALESVVAAIEAWEFSCVA